MLKESGGLNMIGLILLIWFLVGFVHMLFGLRYFITEEKKLTVKNIVILSVIIPMGIVGVFIHLIYFIDENWDIIWEYVVWKKKE